MVFFHDCGVDNAKRDGALSACEAFPANKTCVACNEEFAECVAFIPCGVACFLARGGFAKSDAFPRCRVESTAKDIAELFSKGSFACETICLEGCLSVSTETFAS